MRRAPILITATAMLAIGGVAVALPAAAADIDAGDTLYVIGDETLYTSTSDGALTFVAALTDLQDIYGADWDPTTGLAYFFTDGSGDNPCTLYSLDVVTGSATAIGDLEYSDCDALDVAADGTLRLGTDTGIVATVDKSDASTISDVTVGINLAWLSQAPNLQFYVGDYSGYLYTFDPATGDTTELAQPNDYTESADFDSAGTLWMSANGNECQGLGSLSLADPEGSYLLEGDFLDGTDCISAYALFIVPGDAPPVLPATGPASTAILASIAGVVVLAGAMLLAFTGRRRTA